VVRLQRNKNLGLSIANKSLKNVAKSKYLETMITNPNCIHAEIKNRLNLGDGYYHAIQNLPVSCIKT
jgi:hypothetical protein